ncbi:MAG TPA: hypothetical protein VF665_08090 [Longimicrobium sp.]|jgi:hypothetical protein|uniref:DUF3108 domain-containing protein n=1 Tax=Longimicrobium sp. TaxID=2029185 RepID=UPI002ED90D45
MRTALIALLLIATAAPLAGQTPADTVRPGSAVLRTDHVTESEHTMELTMQASPVPLQMVLSTRLVERGGVPVIIRTERLRSGRSLLGTDSMTVERATLAPVQRVEYGGVWTRTEFTPRGVRVNDGVDKGVSRRLNAPVFLGSAFDLLLGALPLAAGYEAVLPVWDSRDQVATAATARVAGTEEVAFAAGTRSAWRVEVRGSGYAGTYWLDRESRTLLRYESQDGRMRIVRRAAASATHRTSR